ncbi:MAG: T9SS type A sorting domain-containing protein [Saprospiraceae bacterium]|nr:T9SS type A sorting domain-containing protein [Saprospiraceae bacterium]
MNAPIAFVFVMLTACNCLSHTVLTDSLPCDSLWADAGSITLNCTTTSIDFEVTGTTNLPEAYAQYEWTLNGVVVSNTPTVIVQSMGQYIFTVTDTLNGCSASDTLDFMEDLDVPIADAGPSMYVEPCSNPTIILNGSASSSGPMFFYIWEGPGGFIDFNQNPTVSEPGVYTLTVINDENGCSATDVVDVILLFVELEFPIVTTPDSCHTNSGTATVLTGDPSYPVTWSTGETTTTITGLAAGTYFAYVTVGLCQFGSSAVVDSLSCTGVQALLKDVSFTILPNPNNGQFSVLLDVASPLSLEMELLDALGRSIATVQPMKSFGTGQHRIDFQQAGLPSGSYYLLVKNETGRMGMKVEVVR